jgi:hypothetical protein
MFSNKKVKRASQFQLDRAAFAAVVAHNSLNVAYSGAAAFYASDNRVAEIPIAPPCRSNVEESAIPTGLDLSLRKHHGLLDTSCPSITSSRPDAVSPRSIETSATTCGSLVIAGTSPDPIVCDPMIGSRVDSHPSESIHAGSRADRPQAFPFDTSSKEREPMSEYSDDNINILSVNSGESRSKASSIKFWTSLPGQDLLESFGGWPESTGLSSWLALSYPNLYGMDAGLNNLWGQKNRGVAAFVLAMEIIHGTESDECQTLASILELYRQEAEIAA